MFVHIVYYIYIWYTYTVYTHIYSHRWSMIIIYQDTYISWRATLSSEATCSGSETDPQQPWSRSAPATRGTGLSRAKFNRKVQPHSCHMIVIWLIMFNQTIPNFEYVWFHIGTWKFCHDVMHQAFRHFHISCGLTLHLFAHVGAWVLGVCTD